MQKILLIANTLLIIVVIAFLLPMFLDAQETRVMVNEQAKEIKNLQDAKDALSNADHDNKQLIELTQDHIQKIQESQTQKYAEIASRDDAQDKQMNQILQNDTQVQQQITTVESKINTHETRLASGDQRLQAIEAKTDKLTESIANLLQTNGRRIAPAGTTSIAEDKSHIYRQPISSQVPNLFDKITPQTLAGTWQLALPAGFVRQATIKAVGTDQIFINSGGNLNATFKIEGNMLVSTDVPETNFLEYTWQIEGLNRLRLVYSKSTFRVNNDYTGATLTRE